MSVFLRIFLALCFIIFIVFIVVKSSDKSYEKAFLDNRNICGYFYGYYFYRSSRSSITSKGIRVKKDGVLIDFYLHNKVIGLDNLKINKNICVVYFEGVPGDKIVVKISSE